MRGLKGLMIEILKPSRKKRKKGLPLVMDFRGTMTTGEKILYHTLGLWAVALKRGGKL